MIYIYITYTISESSVLKKMIHKLSEMQKLSDCQFVLVTSQHWIMVHFYIKFENYAVMLHSKNDSERSSKTLSVYL